MKRRSVVLVGLGLFTIAASGGFAGPDDRIVETTKWDFDTSQEWTAAEDPRLSLAVGESVRLSWKLREETKYRRGHCEPGRTIHVAKVDYDLTADPGVSLSAVSACIPLPGSSDPRLASRDDQPVPLGECAEGPATGELVHPENLEGDILVEDIGTQTARDFETWRMWISVLVTCEQETSSTVEFCQFEPAHRHDRGCASYTVTCGSSPDPGPDAGPDAGCPFAGACIACESIALVSDQAWICEDGNPCGALGTGNCEGRAFIFTKTGETYSVGGGGISTTSAGTLANANLVTDIPADTEATMVLASGGELIVQFSGNIVTVNKYEP